MDRLEAAGVRLPASAFRERVMLAGLTRPACDGCPTLDLIANPPSN